jgi:hypothetical protein
MCTGKCMIYISFEVISVQKTAISRPPAGVRPQRIIPVHLNTRIRTGTARYYIVLWNKRSLRHAK